MTLKSFESIGKTEQRARKYFKKIWCKNSRVFCTDCCSYKTYRIGDGRYRCKRCGNRFHEFTDRWLNAVHIPFKTWLWVVKLFELEVSARKIAHQTGLSYPTAYKACQVIRMALTRVDDDFWLSGEVEIDESYFGGRRKGRRGRGAAGKVPVLGILERNGRVTVSVVKDVTAESLLKETVKMVRRGSIVYTDKYRGYDALMFCGYRHLKVDHGKRFATGKVYINGLEGFWSFAKQRLAKFHGVSKQHFPLYLKEMEFRYNNRKKNLFTIITQKLCSLVPNRL
jgi:transposase